MFHWLRRLFGLTAVQVGNSTRRRDPFPGCPDCHDPERDAYYAEREAKPSKDTLRRLTAESPDPGGRGVPHNTDINRRLNSQKSTSQIVAEIEMRNQSGKDTWQLRQELARRT